MESAVRYANAGMMEEWIEAYLLFTRKMALPLQKPAEEEYHYVGVVKLPLRLIQREVTEAGEQEADVAGEGAGAELPLLVHYEERKFHCTVHSELLAVLRQRKINAYPAILMMKGNDDYQRFKKYYGSVLCYVGSE